MYGAFYKVLSVNASFDARIRLDHLLKNLDLAWHCRAKSIEQFKW